MSEYAFKVLPVEHCPTSKEGWGMASSRLGCNSTHGYQCVPNKHLTSLIEFCYPMGVNILFEKGLKHFFLIQHLKNCLMRFISHFKVPVICNKYVHM